MVQGAQSVGQLLAGPRHGELSRAIEAASCDSDVRLEHATRGKIEPFTACPCGLRDFSP